MTREQILQAAYSAGFAKAAQSSDPAWLPDYTNKLWARENAGRTGYNAKTNTWSDHGDPNGKDRLIGPGLKVPAGTSYTDAQLHAAVTAKLREKIRLANEWYPGLANQSAHVQQLMLEPTYAGAGRYNKLYAAIKARNAAEAEKQYQMHYTRPDGTKVPIARRNKLNYAEFLKPELDSWGRPPAAPAVRPAAPAPRVAPPQVQAAGVKPRTVYQEQARAAAIAANDAKQRELIQQMRRLEQSKMTGKGQ